MQTSSASTTQEMAQLNDEYFEKFGFVFLICATGKSSEEMLLQLKKRLSNTLAEEILSAREEHEKITNLRLEKLLCEV